MERPTSKAAAPVAPTPDPSEADDLWMEDLPNDLACLSLSSDDEAHAHDFDELGCLGPPRSDRAAPGHEPRHRHPDCGI